MKKSTSLTDTDDYLLSEIKKRLEEKNELLQSQATLLAEMEEMNRQLRDVEKVKSSFLSNIRNEINNPLASIIGLAQQLMTGSGFKEEQIKRIAFLINKEAFSLDFQLKNIFAAAEIEAGEVNPKPAMVDAAELIQDQIDYFAEKAAQNGVRLNFTFSPDNLIFATDPYMLQNIVMNLIANAIEFSNKDGVVNISAVIEDDSIHLSIEDFGKGIESSEYKHIFNRFHQIEYGSTKKHLGHGLGLSIVKEFVDCLHGELIIESEKGKTTIVKITLPAFSADQIPEGFSTGNDVLFSAEEVL